MSFLLLLWENRGCSPVRSLPYFAEEVEAAALQLVELNDAGAAREIAQAKKASAAGHPFAIEDSVIQAVLCMRDDLRLLQQASCRHDSKNPPLSPTAPDGT